MKENTSHLHDHIGYWLRRLSDAVHSSFAAKLEQQGITIPEWCVLIVLYHNRDVTPAEIADEIGIDRAAISRTVEKLVQRSLIQRSIGQDRRKTPLILTDEALMLVPKLAELADQNDREFFNRLSPDEQIALKSTLYKLYGSLS